MKLFSLNQLFNMAHEINMLQKGDPVIIEIQGKDYDTGKFKFKVYYHYNENAGKYITKGNISSEEIQNILYHNSLRENTDLHFEDNRVDKIICCIYIIDSIDVNEEIPEFKTYYNPLTQIKMAMSLGSRIAQVSTYFVNIAITVEEDDKVEVLMVFHYQKDGTYFLNEIIKHKLTKPFKSIKFENKSPIEMNIVLMAEKDGVVRI